MIEKYSMLWGKCRSCGAEFEMIGESVLEDGLILLSEKTLYPAQIKWNKDPFFYEVGKIVDEIAKHKGYSPGKLGDVFQKIFGQLCDLAPDGSQYNMTEVTHCPYCASNQVDWGPFEPPIVKELEIEDVPHTIWDELTKEEKVAKVKHLLNNSFK